MALYLPLSAGAYFDKLQDQWLKLLLLQRFSCDLFSLLLHEVQYSFCSAHPYAFGFRVQIGETCQALG